jgi:hypothetical protein
VADEFDGIEIEEEGHKLDGLAETSETADEFAGIKIEAERELPTVASAPSEFGHKLAELLDKDRSPALHPSVAIEAEDDEPVLRLPDDD